MGLCVNSWFVYTQQHVASCMTSKSKQTASSIKHGFSVEFVSVKLPSARAFPWHMAPEGKKISSTPMNITANIPPSEKTTTSKPSSGSEARDFKIENRTPLPISKITWCLICFNGCILLPCMWKYVTRVLRMCHTCIRHIARWVFNGKNIIWWKACYINVPLKEYT